MSKLNLKYAYFSVPLYFSYFSVPLFKAIYLLPLVRKFVQVPLPLIWLNIHKIFKTASDNRTQDKYQNNNFLKWHAIDWSFFRRDTNEPRHSNFLSVTSRICHKLGKVCVDTSQGNKVFGLDNQLCHPRTFFKQNKNSEKSIRMSNSVKQTTNIDPGDNKIDWLVDVNNSSSFTSKVDCRFLQIQKMSHLLEKLSYLDKIILNKNSKIKLKW